jgi:hypothetical protein
MLSCTYFLETGCGCYKLIVELNCSILKKFEAVAQLGECGAVGAKVVGSAAVVW